MFRTEDLTKLSQDESLTRPPKNEKSSLLSKYQISVQNLEYDYIENCRNGNELEKILKILKSGEEGYFPHLIEVAEKRLCEIKPNSKLLRKVTAVIKKNEVNEKDWENVSKDLFEWVKDVKKKDEELDNRKTNSISFVKNEIRKNKTEEHLKNEVITKRISSTDYESWDKYDPDTEILKMDIQEENNKKEALESQKKMSKNIKRVSFNIFSTDAEAEYEASREKERGNEYFKAGEYDEALKRYTNSLTFKPLATTYTNRALIYYKLKKYQLAIEDCEMALKCDANNFKAYLRMAETYEALQNYNKSLQMINEAIIINPNNCLAQELAERINKKCNINKTKTRLIIEDVSKKEKMNFKVEIKPIKPILKKGVEKKTQSFEIIPIPGGSSMPPPYYKIINSCIPRVIQREKLQILNRSGLLHITTIDEVSDDDDSNEHRCGHIQSKNINAIEDNNFYEHRSECPVKKHNAKSFKSLKSRKLRMANCNIISNTNGNTMKMNKTFNKCNSTHISINNKVYETNNQQKTEANQGGGGEPYNSKSKILLPSIEELHTPYIFMETWNSVKKDDTYTLLANMIRIFNFERITEVIGCKLDYELLSSIIKCLYRHFMVPNEINKVYAVLLNLVNLPRFQIMLNFLEKVELEMIQREIEFLEQHGKSLPFYIKNRYCN